MAAWPVLGSLLVGAAISGAVLGTPAIAEVVAPGHLRIQISDRRSDVDEKDKKARRAAWKAGCAKLADGLTVGKGPWGLGAFATVSCYLGKRRLFGEAGRGDWLITLKDSTKRVAWSARRGALNLAKLSLPPTAHLPQFLADAEYVDLLAYALLDRLPIAGQFNNAQGHGRPMVVSGRYWHAGIAGEFKFKVPGSPEGLTLYRLTWSETEKLWRSEVVGTAKRTRLIVPVPRTKKGSAGGLIGGEIGYELDEAASTALATGPLWVHDAEGPGGRRKEIDAALRGAHADLEDAAKIGRLDQFLKVGATTFGKLLASAASGYVGFRYGLQVLPPEGELGKLLAKTRYIGVLVEIRGGPLRGLRYYYDKLPEAKADLEGPDGAKMPASLGFARHVIGYSFGFSPGFLVDRVTFDPKLGVWNLSADLPASTDEEGHVTDVGEFRPGRSFSVAGELGVEMLSDWYTLRGWYALDGGFSLLKSGATITSNRLGLDAYFTAGPSFPLFGLEMKTALMAFYFYEAVTLASGDEADPGEGEAVIDEISYSSAYAGAGVAISW